MTAKTLVAYNQRHESVCQQLGVDPNTGLTAAEVEVRQNEYGLNELKQEEGKSLFELIWEQFEDTLVRILIGAAVVSFLLVLLDSEAESGITAYVEPLVIVAILVANAVVGVWQESNAEAALDALKMLQSEHAKVLRNGQWQSIDAPQLVPGDIVEIHVGDKVPADMRVIKVKSTSLRVEESQLTGESVAVEKQTETVNGSDLPAQDQKNMVFSSTTVSNGTAVCVVVGTGMNTKIGDIQKDVQDAQEEDQTTPLGKKLDEFGELLQKVIAAICVVVFAINYPNFYDPHHGSFFRGCIYYFKIAVALAVAAIPEGLPAVITTCLALGTRKMAQKNAIVRRLPSVETLGCTTVICSDKTGTLTTGKMNVTKFALPNVTSAKTATIDRFIVSGAWYGDASSAVTPVAGSALPSTSDERAIWSLRAAALVNEAQIESPQAGATLPNCLGEPTEGAVLGFVQKLGPIVIPNATPAANANQYSKYISHIQASVHRKVAVLEFSRDRKSMSSIIQSAPNAPNTLLVKGAPEGILDRSAFVMTASGEQVPLTAAVKETILAEIEQMAAEGLRTLALACIPAFDASHPLSNYDGDHSHPSHKQYLSDPTQFAQIESNLTFCGVVGITDPPRPEVAASIEKCQKAGIRVIMITGDNKLTAQAIAQQIGIINSNYIAANNLKPSDCCVEGKQWEALSEDQQKALLSAETVTVFSRTEPKHKLQIVRTLRSLGEVTAMTGDGVNDAPALKMADIGIAMGITGTEVAKGSADMVLADDRFDSIVVAVEEGRSIYNNMKAFIRYLISSNIGEVASIFFTAALGIPEGLVPVQLLWVNLVTDGLPAAALGFNPPDVNVMSKPPRDASDALISPWVFFRYMVVGIYVGFATVGIFVYWYVFGIDEVHDEHQLVSFSQLSSWSKCPEWSVKEGFTVTPLVYGMSATDPCDYFSSGKIKASTLSLTVLVMIEMLNAFNALSEDGSLLQMPPWSNPWLILACFGSVAVHFVVLYVPFLAEIFNVVPLTKADWLAVMAFASPVVAVDEVLKFCSRTYQQIYPPVAQHNIAIAAPTRGDATQKKRD